MIHGRGLFCCLCVWALFAANARAQDAWEFTPYRVQVYLSAAPDDLVSATQLGEIAAHLLDRADTVVGGGWRLDVDAPPPELAAAFSGGLASLTAAHLPVLKDPPDKIIIVAVHAAPTPSIESREFDYRARQWSSVHARPVNQPRRLAREAFLALTESFSPLARVEEVQSKTALLRLRAEAFAPRDPHWPWAAPGDVFRGVLRTNDRAGDASGVQEIPWTVLEVAEVFPTGVLCHLETGVRGAMSVRRGRFELFALMVPPTRGDTRLEIRARTADARPLSGYEVYVTDRAGEKIDRLGRSDRNGSVTVPSGDGRYRILLVKDGQELLARLPIVPGLAPVLSARIPDDAQRLEVEAFVVGLQESVVDLVARRAVLLARAESRLDDKDLAEAEKLIAEVRRMETRDQLQQRILVERRRFASDDPTVQRKIDRLFDDTTKLLGQYLNSEDVDLLQRRLREARASASATP